MSPETRRKIAVWHLILSVVGLLFFTAVVASSPYERVLMAISITITSADVLATTDVRAES